MSGYSLEDRQSGNQNYKHFSGKTEFSIEEHIFVFVCLSSKLRFLYSDEMNMLIFE